MISSKLFLRITLPPIVLYFLLYVVLCYKMKKNTLERYSVVMSPWYMAGGTRWPAPAVRSRKTGRRVARLWPHEAPNSDRITNQLMFVPPEPSPHSGGKQAKREKPLKKIFMHEWPKNWGKMKLGQDLFLQDKCPVATCSITLNKTDADLIIFMNPFIKSFVPRQPRQVWLLLTMESPLHTSFINLKDVFNWTATYLRDSDIVLPYAKWVYYNDRINQNSHMSRNYAANKTKKVAWFVSNCHANNRRLQYAHELKLYIPVDIYGKCGTKKCPRYAEDICLQMLDRDYKFYLAFENSNCKEYITEKLYYNALKHNVLPVVMGARPEDYARFAPYRSYIHVDEFDSARELAAYLYLLDQDDDLYNSYFRWKGTGEFIDPSLWCRLCAMLHDDFPVKSYRDIIDWWEEHGSCTDGSWKKVKKSAGPGG